MPVVPVQRDDAGAAIERSLQMVGGRVEIGVSEPADELDDVFVSDGDSCEPHGHPPQSKCHHFAGSAAHVERTPVRVEAEGDLLRVDDERGNHAAVAAVFVVVHLDHLELLPVVGHRGVFGDCGPFVGDDPEFGARGVDQPVLEGVRGGILVWLVPSCQAKRRAAA